MSGIKEICEPWDDVFDEKLDEQLAPEWGDLLSEKRIIYTEPYEFFTRTYLSDSILESLENIINVLRGKGGNNTFTIYSLFGGGKTHTLFAIYHAIKKPQILVHEDILRGYDEAKKNRIRQIAKDIEELKDVQIVIIYGKDYKYSGRPSAPIEATNYKVFTVWGYLAHSLGRYDYVRKDDEQLTVPDIPTLREVLGDKPTIILIDEIVDYASGLKPSKIKEEKEYVETIPQFLDRLANAVVGTKVAFVVTLPIEAKAKSIEKTESWNDKDFVMRYWTALHRTAAKDLPALKVGTDEIVDVIKRRNFKEIKWDEAEVNIKDFEREYKLNKEHVFGSYEEIISKMRVTYPYHPDLIEILWDIIEKSGLQKTRDMLKLTRRIIRLIWKSDKNPYIIMPWHLDITIEIFNADLFRMEHLSGYSLVVRKDIIENAEKFDKPELARKIAAVILLKTYIYDSPTPQIHFPSAVDIAKMVYEQEFFMKNKWQPTAIIDTLEQLEKKAYMHYLQIKDGKHWFWRIASVKEQIESVAKNLIDEEKEGVEIKVQEMVEKLISGEHVTKRARKNKITGVKVLNENATKVIRKLDLEIKDDVTYKTVFLVNENATIADCEKIMLKYRDSDRTYKNTIICVYPSSGEEYRNCMRYASLMLACEKIRKELPKLYPNAGDEVLRVQESMIEKLHDNAENEIIRQIFRTFKTVAYSSVEKDKTRVIVRTIEAPEGASTLLDQTYLALVSPQIAKIADSLNFESLKRQIHDILGIDIEKGTSKKISEIKDWFKTNPAFQMVEDVDIEEAIKEGVRNLSIGVGNEEVWYKKVYEITDVEEDIGNVPLILKDEYKTLPWKDAITQQISKLIEDKRSAERERMRIEYEVKYENSIYPLERLMEQENWEEIVRQGLIIKKVEIIIPPRRDFRMEILPSSVTGMPGAEVEIKVKINPVGKEDIFVKLNVELGKITPSEGKLPLECIWKLIVPPESGMKSLKIDAKSEEQNKSDFLMLRIESEIVSTSEISIAHIGMKLFETTIVKDVELIKELNTLAGKKTIISGDVRVCKGEKEVKLALRNIDGDVAEYVISQTKDVVEGEATMDFTVYIPDGIKIDELAVRKISPYNDKAEFKLKKGKENG
ncbi:MAG: DUF499 domain-containing protein [Nitrososphaerales archaeon]